jgi:hypothetical protein
VSPPAWRGFLRSRILDDADQVGRRSIHRFRESYRARLAAEFLKYAAEHLAALFKRYIQKAFASADKHVESIEQQRLCLRAVMLKEIKRDPAVLIDGDNLAVKERTGRQPFTGAGDLRKLGRKQVPSPRP